MKHLPKALLTFIILATLVAFATVSIDAQTITATLTGEVRDTSGALVQGATVTATDFYFF